jgi:hypothetical protein
MNIPLFETGDICAPRHRGNQASREANKRVDKLTDNRRVLDIIKRRIRTHSKEIAAIMNKPLNAISGRIAYLKEHGYIRERNDLPRRDGCMTLEWTGKE